MAAEKEPQRKVIAVADAVEVVVNGDGSSHIAFDIQAETPEGYAVAVDGLSQMYGPHVGGDSKDSKKGRSVGFSSKNWNSSWNPRGPKPNWEVKNKNPNDN